MFICSWHTLCLLGILRTLCLRIVSLPSLWKCYIRLYSLIRYTGHSPFKIKFISLLTDILNKTILDRPNLVCMLQKPPYTIHPCQLHYFCCNHSLELKFMVMSKSCHVDVEFILSSTLMLPGTHLQISKYSSSKKKVDTEKGHCARWLLCAGVQWHLFEITQKDWVRISKKQVDK